MVTILIVGVVVGFGEVPLPSPSTVEFTVEVQEHSIS